MKKSLLKNSIFLAGYKLLAILFPLITSMYVSRILNAEGVGKVALAQNIVSYFVVFANLGIPTYGTREIAKASNNQKKCNKVFSELFIINLISTSICLAMYYFAILGFESFENDLKLYLVVSITLILNIFNVDWFYQGKEEYVYITVRSFIVKVVSLLALFIFVKDIDDYIIYALINCLAVAVNYIFNVINLRKYVKLTIKNLDLKHHLRFILILFSTSLAVELYTQLDTTMLGFISGNEEVGYYSYAIKLIKIVTSIITAVSTILLPRLSYCHVNHLMDEFKDLCNKALKVVVTFSIPATIGIVFVADGMVRILFGNEFIPSIGILRILSPLIVILAVGNLFVSLILVAINKEKHLFYTTLMGAISNICMNSFLIPMYGGKGAAIASVISELIVMIAQYWFVRKDVKLTFTKSFVYSVVATNIAMTIGIILVSYVTNNMLLKMLLQIITGVIIYVVIGVITKNDIVFEICNKFKIIEIGKKGINFIFFKFGYDKI